MLDVTGPTIKTTASCEFCNQCKVEHNIHGKLIYCTHPSVTISSLGDSFATPSWCPVILVSEKKKESFEAELKNLINRKSIENGSNTPDYILAEYLLDCLDAFDNAVNLRDKHNGIID